MNDLENFTSYKEYHENYMKNNNGTSPVHNFLIILPSFFTCFNVINLIILLNIVHLGLKFIVEYVFIVLTLILTVTIFENKLLEINVSCLVITIVTIYQQMKTKYHLEPFIQIPSKRPEYINIVRSTINIITAVCILAVDFKVFPRKLSKTETYGFGLMDVGVGLFVFGNGIVAPNIKDNTLNKNKIINLFINSTPLIALGFSRFLLVEQVDYQVHISEYGVHWNFFITLAFTKIFGSIIIGCLKDVNYTKYAAIVILTLHELCLQLGLAEFVLDENIKRDNFFTANREGIISIFGYVGLYIASVYVGYVLKSEKDIERPKDYVKRVFILTVISFVLWKLVYICNEMFGVSRRLGNMGYVIWVLSIGTTMTTLFCLLEIFYFFVKFDKITTKEEPDHLKTYVPIILNAVNYNGLAFFLLANVLTGLVNITFETLFVPPIYSILILSIYMLVVSGIMTIFYVNDVKLKFW